ncbi:MAG: hypothetical protein LBN93_03165 [Candidatus Symbiothrix sp.]|jgi:hypothetical protein|nr:hypothetical protein [Candidatus Symbiothrix sp.]
MKKKACENITVWCNIISVIAMIVTFSVGLYQYVDSIENKKKEATITYLEDFSDVLNHTDPLLLDTINFFGVKQSGLPVNTLEKLLQTHSAYRRQLDNITVYLNQLAVGFQYGFFDEQTAWGANYYRITYAVDALTPFFELRRKEENMTDKQTVCWFLRDMVQRWKEGKEGKGVCAKWREEDMERIKNRRIEIGKIEEQEIKKGKR